jgi:threonine synthase
MSAHFSLEQMRQIILGVSVGDDETRETIARVHEQTGYFLDPHSAVGWKGADKLFANNKIEQGAVGILCTAHPAKFAETVKPLIGLPPMPASLSRTIERTVNAKVIPAETSALIDFLNSIS